MKRSVTKKPKLTQWFEPQMKPFHIGWYHCGLTDLDPRHNCLYESSRNFWFDGTFWLASEGGGILCYQNRFWRGLAQNPEVQP